ALPLTNWYIWQSLNANANWLFVAGLAGGLAVGSYLLALFVSELPSLDGALGEDFVLYLPPFIAWSTTAVSTVAWYTWRGLSGSSTWLLIGAMATGGLMISALVFVIASMMFFVSDGEVEGAGILTIAPISLAFGEWCIWYSLSGSPTWLLVGSAVGGGVLLVI